MLDPIEIATGMVFGFEEVPPLDSYPESCTPQEAMEQVLIEALARPPCLLSFSGGRDSSGLLAVATKVARREGLPLPVPATLIVPGSVGANEDEWQDMVLRHLGLSERICIEVLGDALDAVGPVATALLKRHGLLYPFNTHFHWPIIERASGGTLVTGFGGDELGLLSAGAKAERVLSSWHRPRLRDPLVVGLATSPRWIRTKVYGRRARGELARLPWLAPEGLRLACVASARLDSAVPLGWNAKIRRWLWRERYVRVCLECFSILGRDKDVQVVHPFVHPRVLDALARSGGFRGFGGRTQLVGALFGDLLPDAVVSRRTKGAYDDALWTATAFSFARSWSGQGIPDVVDTEALRDHWLHEGRYAASALLLQHAWLADWKAQSTEPPPPSRAANA